MAANGFKAIPTVYRGVQMRSRLEAKWAAFFDLLGWRWEYEPFDCDGWIPDFLLPDASVLVEVKPVQVFPKDIAREIEDVIPDDNEALILGCVNPIGRRWDRGIDPTTSQLIRVISSLPEEWGHPIGWMLGRASSWQPAIHPTWGLGFVQRSALPHPPGFEDLSTQEGWGLFHSLDPWFSCEPGADPATFDFPLTRLCRDRFLVRSRMIRDSYPNTRTKCINNFWSQAANRSQWKGIQSVT